MTDADNVRRAMLEDGLLDPVTFLASFPPIQSAIKVGQDGARVQLDIPETELPAIARLLLLRGVVLKVTVELGQAPRPQANVIDWRDRKH